MKKVGMIIFIILIITSVILPRIYFNNSSDYLIIGDNYIYKIKNNKWHKINKRNIKRFSFDEFYTYNGLNFIGKSYIKYADNMTVYNKSLEKNEISGRLYAIKTKKTLKNTNRIEYTSTLNESDNIYLKKIFAQYLLNYDNSAISKYILDIDKNGINDYFYNIRITSGESVVVSVINENVDVIDISKDVNGYSLFLENIIDVDQDGNNELFIYKSLDGSVEYDVYDIYKYNNKTSKFEKLINE